MDGVRLLYCYVRFLDKDGKATRYRGLSHLEFNFSATDKFSYDPAATTLRRKERESPLPEGFWRVDKSSDKSGSDDEYTMELRIWRGPRYNAEGGSQFSEYRDYLGLDTGYMPSFNPNKRKTVGVSRVEVAGKTLFEGTA